MTGLDVAFGFLAGIVSCLTPAALLLFPLFLGAAGAESRAGYIAVAIGLGLSLVLTGLAVIGFEAVWLRRIVCILFAFEAFLLLSRTLMERAPFLTGGTGGGFERVSGHIPRMLLLGFFVGGNWIPEIGPTLGKASLMAADMRDPGIVFGILFVFGLGAAAPWIALGRIARLFLRRPLPRLIDGMTGKRLLGLTLLGVALLGATGGDMILAHHLDPLLPPWTKKLAVTF